MRSKTPLVASVALTSILFSSIGTLHARTWTDSSGKYKLNADMIGFDDHCVILQRADGELGAFPIEKLSSPDKEFLKTKEAKDIHSTNLNEVQTWQIDNGLRVTGRIVDFAQKDVTVQARRGKTYVNNIVFENLPQIYQYMLPMIIAHLEPTGEIDKRGFKQWVRDLKGQPKTFKLSGVLFELENGDEYGVPFFLFAKADQELLKPGWEAWLKSKSDAEMADREAFLLQSQAAAYKQQQERYEAEAKRREQHEAFQRRIAVMNLNLNAIRAGVTSAWEVTLYPLPGTYARPRWVVVLGRDSLEATRNAMRQNPGFRDGPVRKISW